MAGRNASAYRSSEPSSSDCTTLTGTLSSARRTSAASGTSRSGSTPIRNSTSISRSAHARRMSHRVAPGLPVHQRTPGALDVVDVEHASAHRAVATGAPRRSALRDRSRGGSRTGTAPPPRRRLRARRRPPRVARPRARPACRRLPAGHRAPRRAPRRRRRRAGAPRRRGAQSTCVATSCSRVRRGCSTQMRAPRRAALRRRRCRIGTSCSASRPTTRITLARLDVLVGDRHRVRGSVALGRRRARVAAPAMIEIVRAEHGAGELREREVVLVHQAPAGEDRHPRPVASTRRPA